MTNTQKNSNKSQTASELTPEEVDLTEFNLEGGTYICEPTQVVGDIDFAFFQTNRLNQVGSLPCHRFAREVRNCAVE